MRTRLSPDRLLILVITLLGGVLRFWGLGFSASVPRARPDEELFVVAALKMLSGNDNPGFAVSGWPELYFRMIHWSQAVYAAFAELVFGREVHLGCLYALSPGHLTTISRALSALAGTLTIPVMAAAARSLSGDESARRVLGPSAAVLTASSYLHARDSHFGVTDPTLLLFLSLSLLYLVRGLRSRRAPHIVASGLFWGLALSTKYSALGWAPLFAAASVFFVVEPEEKMRPRALAILLLAPVAIVIGFVLGSPHVLDEPKAFYEGLMVHTVRFGGGAADWGYGPSNSIVAGWKAHALRTLPISFGTIGLGLCLIGAASTLWRRSSAERSTALAALAFFTLVLAPSTLVVVRYALPLFPLLWLLGAAGVWELSRAARALFGVQPPALRAASLTVLLVAALVAPARHAIAFARLATRPDTRELAAQWVVAHAKEDDLLITLGAFAEVPSIDPKVEEACRELLPPALAPRLPRTAPGGDAAPWFARLGRRGWGTLAELALTAATQPNVGPDRARYTAVATPLLACGAPSPKAPTLPLDSCHVERARFSPGAPSCDALYDTQDSFFVPYANLEGLEHIGPELRIIENVCR